MKFAINMYGLRYGTWQHQSPILLALIAIFFIIPLYVNKIGFAEIDALSYTHCISLSLYYKAI